MTKRTRYNFWIDFISLIVMIVLAITGGLLRFVLPPGTGHSHSLFGLGRHDIGRVHFYFAVVGIALLAVHVYLHWSWICGVVSKLFNTAVPLRRSQTIWGLTFLSGILLLVGGGMWWASSKVEHNIVPDEEREYRDRGLFQKEPKIASLNSGDRRTNSHRQPSGDCEDGEELAGAPSSGIELHKHEKHLEDCPVGATINGQTTLSEAARKCRIGIAQIKVTLNLPNSVSSSERLGRLKRRYGISIHDVRRLACR